MGPRTLPLPRHSLPLQDTEPWQLPRPLSSSSIFLVLLTRMSHSWVPSRAALLVHESLLRPSGFPTRPGPRSQPHFPRPGSPASPSSLTPGRGQRILYRGRRGHQHASFSKSKFYQHNLPSKMFIFFISTTTPPMAFPALPTTSHTVFLFKIIFRMRSCTYQTHSEGLEAFPRSRDRLAGPVLWLHSQRALTSPRGRRRGCRPR